MNQKEVFLQSEQWLKFQEAAGKKTASISDDGFSANGIIHRLPIVGKYLYVPRGPVVNENIKYQISNIKESLMAVAKKEGARWIRIEPETEEMLGIFAKEFGEKLVKAPHDMQPKEVFVIDIAKDEEILLAEMKPKTRYNIRLAEKRGVRVFETREEKYEQAFLDLIDETAGRKDIMPHPRSYYRNFFSVFPREMCRLFVAEYEGPASTREDGLSTRGGSVLAANLVMIYGTTATYLHGGSSNKHRDTMAPYLLQWEQIRFAKSQGCTKYDFGGIRTDNEKQPGTHSSWRGITRFKTGFSPATAPTVFPGAYDIILDSRAYFLYRGLRHFQKVMQYMKH